MLRATIGDIRRGIDSAIRKGIVSECAVILWAAQCEDGDIYSRSEMNAVPGSVMLGIEEFREGEVKRGVLQFQPRSLNENPS